MSTHQFLADYAAAFASLESAAVLRYFDYPLLVTGDRGSAVSVEVLDETQFSDVLAGLLHAYRALDVAAGKVIGSSSFELSPRLTQVNVRWELVSERGDPVYEFDASYTLVAAGDAYRIRAITHNEIPELMAALAAKA
jgi:hypothetical protein